MKLSEKFANEGLFHEIKKYVPEGLFNPVIYDSIFITTKGSKTLVKNLENKTTEELAFMLSGIFKNSWIMYNEKFGTLESYDKKVVETLSSNTTDTSNDDLQGSVVNAVSGYNSEVMEDESKNTTSNTRVTSSIEDTTHTKTTIINTGSGVDELNKGLSYYGDYNIMNMIFNDVVSVIALKIYE